MEQAIVNSKAIVLQYTKTTEKWIEMGSEKGVCNISILKSLPNEYRFFAIKTVNQEIIINCLLFPSMIYKTNIPSFHQWYDVSNNAFGFNFLNPEEAKNFTHSVEWVLMELKKENNVNVILENLNPCKNNIENTLKMNDEKSQDDFNENNNKTKGFSISNKKPIVPPRMYSEISYSSIHLLPCPSLPNDILNVDLISDVHNGKCNLQSTSNEILEKASKTINSPLGLEIKPEKSRCIYGHSNEQNELSKEIPNQSDNQWDKTSIIQSNTDFYSIPDFSTGPFLTIGQLENFRSELMKDIITNIENIKNEIISKISSNL